MVDGFDFTEDDLDLSSHDMFETDEQPGIRSVLGNDVEMDGVLNLRNGIEINGCFDGTMVSNSLIHVKEKGELNGDINAYHVIIEGKSTSNMTARKRLEILKGGTFTGTLDIQPEVIVLSEHASFGSDEKVAKEFADEFVRDRKPKTSEETSS
jgi:cytoskeletal protein CcmA (bactofilin family)